MDDHIKTFNGLSTKKKLAMLNVDNSLQETINNRKQELTHIEMMKIPTSDRLISIMKAIKEQGIQLMCASNCVRSTVDIVLTRLGIFGFFDKVLSNEDVSTPKPSPEIYKKCMEYAHVSPANTLVFEDSYVGLQAAVNSGANVHRVESPGSLSVDYVMNATENLLSHVNIVIPMAGNGSRFSAAGYKDPKPFIPVFGNPMISWVVKNLGIKANYTFIIRKEFDEVYNATAYLKTIAENCNIVTIDKTTDGAACTVLLAKEYINNSNPIIIINSDQYIEFEDSPDATKFIFDFLYNPAEKMFDGKISTFDGQRHPKWSYAKVGDEGIITEVREKDPFSDHATTGMYMWRRGSDFVKYAGQMIEKNLRVNNEFYVVPVFNEAINDGLKFETCKCKRMWGIGVPEDLNYFLENYKLKIAIFYSGEPRDIKNTFSNHREMIFQNHQVDIYMHTWKTHPNDIGKATPDELGYSNEWRKGIPYVTNNDYVNILSPKKYILEDRTLTSATPFERQQFMYHGIKQAFSLVPKAYDIYIRCRPDLVLLSKINYRELSPNTIYLPVNCPEIDNCVWTPDNIRISDFLCVGTKYEMLKHYTDFVVEKYHVPDGSMYDPCSQLGRHLATGFKIGSLEVRAHLFRNIIRMMT